MIYEAYVSFETAKLLKEKGFDECIFEFYEGDRIRYARNEEGFRLSELPDIYYPHITDQMAMAWLREAHKVLIVIDAYHADHWEGYIDSFEIKIYSHASTIIVPNEIAYHTDYTEAVETALKYSLENLI